MSEIELEPEEYSMQESGLSLYERINSLLARVNMIYLLLGVCGCFFLAAYFMGGFRLSGVQISLGANYGPYVKQGSFWRLVTSIFLHADLMHLVVNGYSLYLLGRFAESVFGKMRMVSVFILSGTAAALVSALMTGALSIGASGGVAGLLGLIFAFTLRFKESLNPKFRRTFFYNIGFVLVLNVGIGLAVPGIDNWAHLGGFLFGFLCGWLVWPAKIMGERTSGRGASLAMIVTLLLLIFSYAMLARYLLLGVVYPNKAPTNLMQVRQEQFQLRFPSLFEPVARKTRDGLRFFVFTNHYNYSVVLYFLGEQDYKKRLKELAFLQAEVAQFKIRGQIAHRAAGQEAYNREVRFFYQLLLPGKAGSSGEGKCAVLHISDSKPISSKKRALLDRMADSFYFMSRRVL